MDQGSRYPILNGDVPLNMDEVTFNGISDPLFKPNKIAGEAFYLVV